MNEPNYDREFFINYRKMMVGFLSNKDRSETATNMLEAMSDEQIEETIGIIDGIIDSKDRDEKLSPEIAERIIAFQKTVMGFGIR